MHADHIAALRRVADLQYGVVSYEQVLKAGISRQSAKRLVATKQWRRVHPDVYSLWTPTGSMDRWYQAVTAGNLWLGSGSAVSHRAAGRLRLLDGFDDAAPEFSTTSRRRASGLIVHRVSALDRTDVRRVKGIPVTSVERTLIDLASVINKNALELALESALRKQLTTTGRIAKRLDVSKRVPGASILRSLLQDGSLGVTESVLEARLRQVLRKAGLPPPVPQFVIRMPEGKFVARVDFAYPEAKLAIEADGYRAHSKPPDFRRDRIRLNAITKLGWLVHVVMWTDLEEDPEAVAREIAEVLALRTAGANLTGAELGLR